MAEKKERLHNIVADNRKARFNYEIGEVFEAKRLGGRSSYAPDLPTRIVRPA